MKHTILTLLLLLIFPVTAVAQTEREIVEVRNGIYRATSEGYHSLIWDTSEGLVVVDPISDETARWLQRELEQRFQKPVRYLIYSHNHPDHSLGGEIFNDPRTITIGHHYAAEDMKWTQLETRPPQLTFEETLRLTIDGETLVLRYHGPNNGRGSVSFHFETSKVLFVVDWIVVGRMPYKNLPGYDIHGMIRSTREVLALDWDLFVGGHAEMGGKAEVRRYLHYLETLYAAVRNGMLAGKSLETLKEEILLEEFSDFRNFEEWRAQNIEGVYRTLEDASYILRR